MRWYDKWLTKRINQLSIRIEKLTKTIEGTDYEIWPEARADFEHKRVRLAFKRSNLIKKRSKLVPSRNNSKA